MSEVPYSEFEWRTAEAANGESGVGLAQVFINLVAGLMNVKRVCDLGCGNGYITGKIAALGYEVTGVDASETGIELARRTFSNPTFIRSLIDANLRETAGLDSFDLVISSDVIEHLYRPADLIEAAVSILKPSGLLIIGTPYHGYLKNLALSVTGKMDSHFCALDDCGHIKFFSEKTLSKLIRRHGFADLSFSYYGRAPWLWKNMICQARRQS